MHYQSKEPFLFNSRLIDSSRYRKFKYLRYCLYFSVLVSVWIFLVPFILFIKEDEVFVEQNWNIDFVILGLLIPAISAISLYYWSSQYKEKGEIKITDQGIRIIKDSSNRLFKFSEIEKLKIERGSTFHFDYQEGNHLLKVDNWLSFYFDYEHRKFEFLIDTKEKNKEFEALINSLTRLKIQHEYLTI